MKQKIKELICRIFGHRNFVEVSAVPYYAHNGHGHRHYRKVRYAIIERTTCERCKDSDYRILANGLSRAQMLHDGWFIENFEDIELNYEAI